MAFAPLAYVEQHPYTSAAIAGIVAIGLFYVALGRGAPATDASNNQNTGYIDAEIASSNQARQFQAQLQGQSNQLNAQLMLDAQDNANKLEIAKLDAHLAESGQAYQYQTAAGSQATTISLANISAQVANLQTTTAGQVAEATTAAQISIQKLLTDAEVTVNQSNNSVTRDIAMFNAQTQQFISANQTQVAVTQANDNLEAVKATLSQKTSGSVIDGIANIAGAALAFL